MHVVFFHVFFCPKTSQKLSVINGRRPYFRTIGIWAVRMVTGQKQSFSSQCGEHPYWTVSLIHNANVFYSTQEYESLVFSNKRDEFPLGYPSASLTTNCCATRRIWHSLEGKLDALPRQTWQVKSLRIVSFSWLPLAGRTIACPTAVLLIWLDANKKKSGVSNAALGYFQLKVGEGNLVDNSKGFSLPSMLFFGGA